MEDMNKITLKIQEEQEDALSELVLALEKSLGCRVAFKQSSVYEVESEDPRAIAILQSVFGETEQVLAGLLGQKLVKAAKKEKKPRTAYTRKNVCYEITSGEDAGKLIAAGPLALRLKAGSIAPETTLRHPEKGDFIVKTDGDEMKHFQLAKEPEAVEEQPG
jgi:hypothetical protein